MVPIPGSKLTGGLTYKDRRGTIVDWNLCFTADGTTTTRNFRSGTPAFMAPVLLDDEPIARRTLAHDMESFFAVIIWMASLNYDDEDAFQAKPLVKPLLDSTKAPKDIVNSKLRWFKDMEFFRKEIVDYFEQPYQDDERFLRCLYRLCNILYPLNYFDEDAFLYKFGKFAKNKSEEAGDADPIKEGLFRMCMKEIDDYLHETKGCSEMQLIDSNALAQHTPEVR